MVLPLVDNGRVFNKDGKSLTLGKMKSYNNGTLQGAVAPWQKLRVFTLTKFLFCRLKQKRRHNY